MSARAIMRLSISMVVFALFMIHVSGLYKLRFLETVESFSYDARVLLTLPETNDPRVVVLDLDEKSLAAEGQWPWPRNKMAALMNQLFDQYKIGALGFDIVFAEPDVRAVHLLDELAQNDLADLPGMAERAATIRARLDYDRQFADALKGRPVVMGVFFKQSLANKDEAPITGGLCAPILDKSATGLYGIDFIQAVGYGGNVPVLQESVASCGFFDNPRVDDDGVFRRVPLVQWHEGSVYPSLALAMARLAKGNPPIQFEFEPPDARTSLNLERVRIGDIAVPVDGDVAAYVPYKGGPYTFTYVSATDVLHGKADAAPLNGALVLMGTSAAGLLDFRTTPVAKIHPGVEVHASLISGMLDGTIRQRAPYYIGIETTLLLFSALLIAWAFSRFSAMGSAAISLGLVVVIMLLALLLWSAGQFIMPMGMPMLFALTVFMAHLLYGYFIESRGKREISKLFGQYVPPELVEEMAAHPEEISMEGESRDMTVLFSDVRGFTTISEKLDAKELAAMMNAYLTKQTAVVQKHRGTIDKYIGDAIMSFWGAPLADKDHVLNGVQAGMEMVRAVRELDEEFTKRGWPKLNIGVGINTGKMNVGNMGSEFRMAYTVMGDAVNLGARLEGLTKEYGVALMISEYTRNQLPGDWAFRELDLIRVKGKNEPVAIYEPMGPKDQLDPGLRNDLARHRGAMKLYRAQKWDEAEAEFFNLKSGERPHPVYDVMIQRIMEYREESPGPQWDGAYNFTHK